MINRLQITPQERKQNNVLRKMDAFYLPELDVGLEEIVGSAVMLCLLGNVSQLRPLSSVPCLISMHLSFVPCLLYSMSHFFRVSFCSIPYLFHVSAKIMSQIMSRLQATSRNQLCVTRIEIGDSWRNNMYIERADILYSVELSD